MTPTRSVTKLRALNVQEMTAVLCADVCRVGAWRNLPRGHAPLVPSPQSQCHRRQQAGLPRCAYCPSIEHQRLASRCVAINLSNSCCPTLPVNSVYATASPSPAAVMGFLAQVDDVAAADATRFKLHESVTFWANYATRINSRGMDVQAGSATGCAPQPACAYHCSCISKRFAFSNGCLHRLCLLIQHHHCCCQ